jgi:excisionase family DNA binding protein
MCGLSFQVSIPEEIVESISSRVLAIVSANLESLPEKKQKEFLTLQETAEMLNVKVNTIYSYNVQKILPTYKVGRSNMYKYEDVIRFMEKNRSVSSKEIKNEAIKYIYTKKTKSGGSNG